MKLMISEIVVVIKKIDGNWKIVQIHWSIGFVSRTGY